jgi:cytochrome c oxidase subunit II
VTSYGSDPSRRPACRPVRRAPRSALVLGGVALALTGCSSEELPRLGLPDPITREGKVTLSLWQGSWIAALAVGAIVWALIIAAPILYRKRSERLPPQVRYNLPIEVLYTVVPFIIVAVLFFFTARDESTLLALRDNPDQTINVVGRQWSWTFNYVDEDVYEAGTPGKPPTLYLPQGQRVRFQLTSPDVIHSFWVLPFVFKMDVIPGRQNEFEVTAEKTGRFRGKCAELCGVDHARMLFNAEVVTPQEFDREMTELRDRGQTGLIELRVTESGETTTHLVRPGEHREREGEQQ